MNNFNPADKIQDLQYFGEFEKGISKKGGENLYKIKHYILVILPRLM